MNIQIPLYAVLASLTAAVGEADDLLPEEGTTASIMTSHANDVIVFAPWLAGAACAAVCLGLHFFACRSSARSWSGASPGWWTFWGVPVIASAIFYFVLCAAVVAFGTATSAEFGGHFWRNFGLGTAAAWLIGGTLVAVSPMLVRVATK